MQSAPDQSDAETARLNRHEGAALRQEAADNRSLLNAANRTADAAYYGPAWNGGEAFALDVQARRTQSQASQIDRLLAAVGDGSAGGRSVEVKAGDTLSGIAGTSDPKALDRIAQYNGLASRHEIRPGQSLVIPSDEVLGSVEVSGAVAQRGAAGASYYAQRQAEQAASKARDRFNFSDGMDAKDIRETFVYQSRVSRELSDLDAQARYRAGNVDAPSMRASAGPVADDAYEKTRTNLGAALAIPVVAAPAVVYVGSSTLATLGKVYTTVGPAGTAGLGFVTAAGMDAAGQYAQTDTVRWEQTAFAGTIGMVSGPLGATSGATTNVVLGSAGGVLNTAFNNWRYDEDNDLVFPAALGGGFGALGYFGGSLTTKFVSNFRPEISYPNLNPQVPLLFQAPTVDITAGTAGVFAGGVTSGVASFVPPPSPPDKK